MEFSSAAFRVFHSGIQNFFFKVYKNGTEVRTELKDQYFHPMEIYKSGICPFLRGLAAEPQNQVGNE